jgi:hypothetical protein
MAIDRSLLAQALGKTTSQSYLDASPNQRALLQGQEISKFAMDSSNFGSGQARGVGLAAQLATAGVGAFTQYRAQKDLNEQELASQQQFAKQFPHLADIASTLSPETRHAYTLETIKASLKTAEPQSSFGKLAADYKAGLIDAPTYKAAVRKESSFAPDSAASGGATGAIINNLRRENPNLSYSQALMQAQGLARQGLGFDASGNVAPVGGLTESKGAIKAAESKGTETGKKEGELASKSITAPQVLDLVNQAEKLLPDATSGRIQNIFTAGGQVAGISTKRSKADSRLDVIAADLTSNVPRMEGPQGVADLQLYKEAAGNVGNRNIPFEDRLAALQTIKSTNEKYAKARQNPFKAPVSGKFTSSNGVSYEVSN